MDRKSFLVGLSTLALSPMTEAAKETTRGAANVRDYGAKGDGIHDDTPAFRACLEREGVARLPVGLYLLRGLVLDGKVMHGEGTIKTDQTYAIVIQGEGARIQGLRFKTLSSKAKAEIHLADGCRDVSVVDCHFEGKAYSVISADKNSKQDGELLYKKTVQRVIFSRNYVRGYVVPLYLHSVSEILIEGNMFTESFYDAIRLRQAVERVIISHNHFLKVGISTEEVSRDAVDTFWSGQELIITHNIIRDVGSIGLDLKGHEPQGRYLTHHVLVAHNLIEYANYCGILLSAAGVAPNKRSAGPMSVQGNVIRGCNRRGQNAHDAAIWLHHGLERVQIMHNQIDGHQGHGIAFTEGLSGAPIHRALQIQGNMISGCRFQGKAAGIFGHRALLVQIQGNMIESCDQVLAFEKYTGADELRRELDIRSNCFQGAGFTLPDLSLQDWIAQNNKVT